MFGLGNITKSVNLSLSQNNGLGKPTVKFEFEDNNSLFDFFVKTNKAGTEYAQNVEFEDVQDFERDIESDIDKSYSSNSKKTNNKKKNISTSTLLYLPNSTDKEDNTKNTNPKSLPPSGPEKKKNKTTNPKALPPSSTPNLPDLKSVLKPEGVYINHRKIGDYGYINDNLKYINFYIDKEYMVNDNIFKWSERIFPHAVIIICFQDSNGIWKFFFQRPKYKDFIYKKFPNSFIQNSSIKYFIFDLQHIEKVIQAFESEGFPVVLIHRNIVENINDLSTQTKVWNLRKEIENQPDFVSVDNSKKSFEGAKVFENRELDRVQIKFDGIPSEDCRNDLKSNGFRWSPYYKVWQRKLTPQAVSMAYRIVEKYYNQISLGKPTVKFEFENNDDVFKMFETPGLSGNMFAVFNCPISDLKCLGFSPTYKKLSSYDSLVDTPQGGKTLMGYGFESATLNELNNACKYYKQVEKLAKHLKGDSPLQSAFNVWYFLHENIIYNYDTEGQEEIRTPARSWADRLTGIDCDCLAVLTACLLFNMGYKPKFEIVGFNNNCYSHIFVNLDGLAIDRVLPTFLKRPDGITNTKIMEIPVFELNGGDELINDCLLNGIYQSTLKKVVDNANSNDIINLRKIELLNNLQNSDTNAFKLASILMPYVSLIDDDGNFYFTDSVIADSAELADNRLYELYTSCASDSEKENFLKQFVSAFREIQIEVESGNKPFVNVKIQNVFSKPFTVEGNMIEKKLITLNPNFNRIKEAILFLLSVNYADLAKKIAVGLLPLDRVVNNGYNEEKWENAKIANAKLFEFWRLLGGDTALLIDNIKDGYYNNLSGCKTLSGVDSIDETITTDIAVERIGNFLTVMLDWYKDIEPLSIIQNNDNHIVNSVSADSNSLEDNSLLSSNAFIAEQPKISVNNPGLWIVAAAALGLSAVALSKNKK